MNRTFHYCFVFMCQQGELEIKSLLLALSLKRFLRCGYELVAAIPQPTEVWGKPDEQTILALQSLGVRIEWIVNSIGEHYPIGNKLTAMAIKTSADKTIFLDSDIVCMQHFEHQERFALYDVHVKAADIASYSKDVQAWDDIYELFQLTCPSLRIESTVSQEMMPPYYNAGFVAVSNACELSNRWVEISQRIDVSDIPNKYPWLDQIALPIALVDLDLKVDVLGEMYNYPLNLKPLNVNQLPYFCHYHAPEMIRREPVLNRLVLELVEELPQLYRLMQQNKKWSVLFDSYKVSGSFLNQYKHITTPKKWPKELTPPELIVTGIPRSGTSYLCKLLHQIDGILAINEPEEVFSHLIDSQPWKFAIYYRDLRRSILAGDEVVNKMRAGVMIEDTAAGDQREIYRPHIKRADFILATKNTLAYVSRISNLRQVMPNASIFACIRNPYDTIASWKSTFEHLKQAHVSAFSLGGVEDVELTDERRKRLKEIDLEPSLAIRRAMLWTFLAEGVYNDFDTDHTIKYEDLCANPTETIHRILLDNGRTMSGVKKIKPSQQSSLDVLDFDDLQAIRDVCFPAANFFGYNLRGG